MVVFMDDDSVSMWTAVLLRNMDMVESTTKSDMSMFSLKYCIVSNISVQHLFYNWSDKSLGCFMSMCRVKYHVVSILVDSNTLCYSLLFLLWPKFALLKGFWNIGSWMQADKNKERFKQVCVISLHLLHKLEIWS